MIFKAFGVFADRTSMANRKMKNEEGAGVKTTHIVDTFSQEVAEKLSSTFDGSSIVALDAEGVDLSRLGLISIVQVSTQSCCVLFDVLGKTADDPLVQWLRTLLENPTVVKVIHDCRMDADALYHHLRIDLKNIHDTSCWHASLTGFRDESLSRVLVYNRLDTNQFRDSSVYNVNPAFWASRPITKKMKDWASGDVQCMFALYEKQLGAGGASANILAAARRREDAYLSWKRASVDLVTAMDPGYFIGRGGSNVRQLQDDTSTMIYRAPVDCKGYQNGAFMVYYHAEDAFAEVQEAAACTADEEDDHSYY